MKRLWRRHPWLVAAFAVTLALALAFGGAALRQAVALRGSDPGPVQAWMTPRFLVHAYGLAPERLAAVLGRRPGESPRDTLAEIAAAREIPAATLIAAVEALRAAEPAAGGNP